MNILILEDEALTREYLALEVRLAEPGAALTLCASLDEVLRTDGQFDLAFLDLRIGNRLEGISAGKFLKTKGTDNLVFVTAFSDQNSLKEAAALMPQAYLTKPINATQVGSTLGIIKHLGMKSQGFGTAVEQIQFVLDLFRKSDEKLALINADSPQAKSVRARLQSCVDCLGKLIKTGEIDWLEKVYDHITVARYATVRLAGSEAAEIAQIIEVAILRLKAIQISLLR